MPVLQLLMVVACEEFLVSCPSKFACRWRAAKLASRKQIRFKLRPMCAAVGSFRGLAIVL
jgi:hypothetical protein